MNTPDNLSRLRRDAVETIDAASLERLESLDQQIRDEPEGALVTDAHIKRLILVRQLRGTIVEADLFADPAWEILLTLYAAELADKRLTVGKLCSSVDVPPTTAARWLKVLVERGLVRTDAANQFSCVALSAVGSSTMNRYFTTVSTARLPF